MSSAPLSTPSRWKTGALLAGSLALLLTGAQHASATPPAVDAADSAASRAPVEQDILIGAAVKSHLPRTTLDQEITWLENAVGTLEIRRVFDAGFNTDFMVLGGRDVGVRATHLSFKPDMNQLAAGTLDSTLRSFLATIPAGHRTILTIWHEPEDNFTTEAAQATYRDAWRRFADLVHEAARPELSTSWVMMAWSWRGASGRDPIDWFPGESYVDVVGIDMYNEGSLAQTRWDSPGRSLGQPFAGDSAPSDGYVGGGPLQWIRDRGMAWGIAEVGTLENVAHIDAPWAEDDEKFRWIRRGVRFFADEGATYVEYFHSGPYRAEWWLDSTPEAVAAYRWAIRTY